MTRQSFEQLKAMLWSESGARVFAVIDGGRVPDLAARLAAADVLGADTLWRGAQPPARAAVAPHVVELSMDSPFTDWLLGKAGVDLGSWGVVGVGPASLLQVRELGRHLSEVEGPSGQARELVWYDPVLWTALLPRLTAGQLSEAFGPLRTWVAIRRDVWTWLTLSAGDVVVDARQCLPAETA